jgi:hypothetical protein
MAVDTGAVSHANSRQRQIPFVFWEKQGGVWSSDGVEFLGQDDGFNRCWKVLL